MCSNHASTSGTLFISGYTSLASELAELLAKLADCCLHNTSMSLTVVRVCSAVGLAFIYSFT